jgi:hypothetical protein
MTAVPGQGEDVVELYRAKAVDSVLVLGSYAVVAVGFAVGYWYSPSKITEYSLFVRLLSSLCVHLPEQSASASNKTQTDLQSVALVTVAPSEGGRLLGWKSTLLA